MEQSDIRLDGDTLIIPDGDSVIMYGQSTRKLVRVPIKEWPEPARELYLKAGFFRTFSHVPTQDLRKVWHGFSSLTLLVSRRCNLNCRYCYASAQPSGPLMSEELALNAVRCYLQGTEKIKVSFHGGGEPTLNMPVLKAVTKQVRECATGRKYNFSVVTNGIFDTAIADWLMSNHFSITISWDGPPEVQDRNRPLVGGSPSSRRVEKTVRYLTEHGYKFSVRTTISSLDDIRATINYFASYGVKKLHLEPLFPSGRDYQTISFGNTGGYHVSAPFGIELAGMFMEALNECEKLGIKLQSTALNNGLPSWHGTTFCGHACGRGMVATHDGFLTTCSEVVDAKDPAAPVFHYGCWDREKQSYQVDELQFSRLLKRHIKNILQCSECFARYACGGGCAIKAFRRTADILGVEPENCAFIRTLVPELIKRAIRKQTQNDKIPE